MNSCSFSCQEEALQHDRNRFNFLVIKTSAWLSLVNASGTWEQGVQQKQRIGWQDLSLCPVRRMFVPAKALGASQELLYWLMATDSALGLLLFMQSQYNQVSSTWSASPPLPALYWPLLTAHCVVVAPCRRSPIPTWTSRDRRMVLHDDDSCWQAQRCETATSTQHLNKVLQAVRRSQETVVHKVKKVWSTLMLRPVHQTNKSPTDHSQHSRSNRASQTLSCFV